MNAVIAKQLGKGFRPQEVAAVLAHLREPLGNQYGTSREPAVVMQLDLLGTTTGTTWEPATLLHVDSKLASSSKELSAQKPSVKQLRLPKSADELAFLALKRAILSAVWTLVQVAISRSMTAGEWGRRNARPAADMARAGVTPEAAVQAWHSASDRIGEPVRTMALVQDEISRGLCAKAAADEKAQARAAADAKRHYFTAPPPAPWDNPRGAKA